MRPGCVLRLTFLSAAALACGIVAACARDEDLFVRPEDQHTVMFGNLDAGRSVFVTAGAKQTVTGPLDRAGFAVMEATGIGLTRERYSTATASLPVDRFVHQSTLMGGFQQPIGPVFLAAFVGPELHEEQLAVAGRFYRLSQPRLGVRGQIEVWAHPTDDTMLTGTVVAGSTRSSLWARLSAGVRVFDKAFIGPEVVAYATPTYSEVRWGAHLTGPAIGIVTLRLSVGWMHDDAHRHGSPYAGFSAWMQL